MGISLEDARDMMFDKMADGSLVRCPCCTQAAKIYKRKLNANMVRILITMYINYGTTYVKSLDMSKITGRNDGELAKNRYWGLIEEHPTEKSHWKVTSMGVDFIMGRATVTKYALTFNSNLLGYEGKQVGIRECIGEKFDYDELMSTMLDISRKIS